MQPFDILSIAKWRPGYRIVDLVFIALMVCLTFGLTGQRKQPFVLRATILVAVQESHLSLRESQAHNAMLLSILEGRYAAGRSLFAARMGTQMQARLFFLAVFTMLVTLSVNSAFPISSLLSQRVISATLRISSLWRAIWFAVIALVISVVMFLLDVHLDDSMRIQRDSDEITSAAIDRLSNRHSSDSTLYVLNYDGLNEIRNQADRTLNRSSRKLAQAAYPNMEQKAFYLLPGFAAYLLVWYLRTRRTQRASPDQS